MKIRTLLCAGLALAAVQGSALALTLDYPINCFGSIDSDLSAAIGETASGAAVRALVSAGSCSIQSVHTIDGAVTFSLIGAGTSSTFIDVSGSGNYVFLVGTTTGGVNFSVRSLTLENAQHGAIGILQSTLQLDQVRFLNDSGSFGGAIGGTLASAAIKRSSFEGGNAGAGGAIAMEGGNGVSLSVTDSTFSNNTSSGNGGAIRASVPVSLDRVLFSGNQANSAYGGAVYIGDQNLTVRNSTFTGNSAASGGAIVAEGSGGAFSVVLNNATLHGDSASSSGSEIFLASSMPTSISILNSLVGGTCAGFSITPIAHGSVESPGNTCGFSALMNMVNITDASLMLAPLADNGGATKTLYPNAGSALINAASSDCERVDQRELVRNVGACDVGAVEAGATQADVIFADGFGN